MSSKQLHKMKMTKSQKKEKLIELQKGFVSNFKPDNRPSQYNALEDKYASHYFLNRPVKKHLKKLAKAVHLEPLTTQNQKIISSLNEMMQTFKTKSLSHRNLEQTFNNAKDHPTASNKSKQKSNHPDKSSKKRIISSKIYDPYSQSMKPSIQKIRKIKLDILKKKRYVILDNSIQESNEKSKQREMQQSIRLLNHRDIPQRRNQSLNNCKGPKFLQKVQLQNHSKHLKLLTFINKKKSQLQSFHSSNNNKKSSVTQVQSIEVK